jgi:RNA polymerase sigma-70 factor (ECF subfamily)
MGGGSAKMPEEFNHPDFAKRLKAGNESAFRELFDYLSPWAKSFIKRKYSLSEEDARDITQDFFRRIIEKIELYDENEGRFLSWAFQILRNLTVDWLRRYKRFELIPLSSQRVDGLELSYIDDDTTTPKDDLSALEKLPTDLRTAFLKLNHRYQQLLGLWLEGSPTEAIRKALNIPSAGAFWTQKSRALAKLKEEHEKIKSKGGQR